jgi:hypothetical protein
MNKFSAKNKIISAAIAWILVSVFMVMYGFSIFSSSNQKTLFEIEESKKELAALQAEKNSYAQAQKDLEQMSKEQIQPQDFFSKDITWATESKFLEDLQDSLGVKLQVSGVSGTIETALTDAVAYSLFEPNDAFTRYRVTQLCEDFILPIICLRPYYFKWQLKKPF